MSRKISSIKVHYGVSKKVKGRYFDIALYHIKYIHAIEYPENLFTHFAGKFGGVKSNNIRIFKRLRIIYKLRFDRKSQWLTKFNHIYTIKNSLQCCREFDYIGLNLMKSTKQLQSFKYNFPYRVSFDVNRIKDINYLKYSRDMKTLSINIDSFDNKEMYQKLFAILSRKSKLQTLCFTKININLARPYLDILKKIQNLSIVNELQFDQIILLKQPLENLRCLSVFTAAKCLKVLGGFNLFSNLERLELNDFVLPFGPKTEKSIELFEGIEKLGCLKELVLELNLTMKNHTNLFFYHFRGPPSLKRLEFILMNLSFAVEDDSAKKEQWKCVETFYKSLENLQQLEALKICFSVYDDFSFVNEFVKNLPRKMSSLQAIDALFRTENEYDEAVYLDYFLQWAGEIKTLSSIVLRTTNLTISEDFDGDFDLPNLGYLRLTEEFGRKSPKWYNQASKNTIRRLEFLRSLGKLHQVDLNLNFTDLSEAFAETLLACVANLPQCLKVLKLRIIHKNDTSLEIDQERISLEIKGVIEKMRGLKVLELNLPLYFRFNLGTLEQFQHVVIPGTWKERPTRVIYYWL